MDSTNIGETLPHEWFSQKEELNALRSIYSGDGECVLVSPSKDTISFDELLDKDVLPSCLWPLVLNINLPSSCHFSLTVTFQLDTTYPNVSPQLISLESDQLTEVCLSSLKKRAILFAATLQPEPCLFDILEWLKDSVSDITESDVNRESFNVTTTAICDDIKGTNKPHNSASIAYSVSNHSTILNPSSETTSTILHEEEAPLKGRKKLSESMMYPHRESPCQAGERTQEVTTSPNVLCVVKLDHMRNEHKYFKLLNSWAKELDIHGKALNGGAHSIYVVLIGTNNTLSEFLRRWKTQNVDVDSKGKPCKEKLMRILCQEMLTPLSGISKRPDR